MKTMSTKTIVSPTKELDDRIPFLLHHWEKGTVGGYSILSDCHSIWRIYKVGTNAHYVEYGSKDLAVQAAESRYLYEEAS